MTHNDDSAVPSAPNNLDLLLADLRAAAQRRDKEEAVAKATAERRGRDDVLAKAAAARANADAVMVKASVALAEGRITAHAFAVLNATRLRLDAELPLPPRKTP